MAQFAVVALLSLRLGASPAAPRPAAAQSAADRALARRLSALLNSSAARHGFWGVFVYSLDRHRPIYSHNANRWFLPASNAKLFTLAAALQLLGPNYRFHTPVVATTAPNSAGVVDGNLVLVGSGDPSLSGRAYPYHYVPQVPGAKAQMPYDMMAAARALAAQVVRHGVTRVRGDIVGDDRDYAWDPYPPGWAADDLIQVYGAPVAALTINDNRRAVLVMPGVTAGAPARLTLAPGVAFPKVENDVTTGPRSTGNFVHLESLPLGAGFRLSGQVALDGPGVEQDIAVADPALYAAQLLRQALVDAGVRVDGAARARHRPLNAAAADPPAGTVVAQWVSPPLEQILQVTAKVSQNLHAELVLRLLGKLRGDPATGEREAGERVLQDFLHRAGVTDGDVKLTDASGLSRLDLVTPTAVERLLHYMAVQPDAADWKALFPVAARDGTLALRFQGSAVAGRMRAKTGSLTHVECLSGYVTTRHGEHLAFAVMADNLGRPAEPLLDRLAAAMNE